MSQLPDIILGVYNGYQSLKTAKGGLYYFAESLRKYNKKCKIVILCEQQHIFTELREFCEKHEIEIFSNFKIQYKLMYYRFYVYKDYLDKCLEQDNILYNKILLSDIDDVVFQADPFSINFDKDIYCGLEQSKYYVNESSAILNMDWIKNCIHVDKLDITKLRNRYVVCAGTIMGTYKGILNYLHFYRKFQYGHHVDQALWNIYVYNHLESKQLDHYHHSRILTLDNVHYESLNIRDSKIVNNNDEVYAIIHQGNRCNLKAILSLIGF